MDRVAWNNLVRTHAPRFGAFLQSWEWGEFQSSLGRPVERIHLDDTRGAMLAQAIRYDLPFGWTYWSVPKGPLGTMPAAQLQRELKQTLLGGVFVRVEPREDGGGYKVKDAQPSTTSIIDLTQGGEAVMAQMKQKTRYNIRLAEKKGVVVKIVGLEAFDDFTRLAEQTAVRDQFFLHPHEYYRAMLERLHGDTEAFLAIAYYDDRPLAANIMTDFQGQRTYLHGASSNLHRNVMAPYLLHQFLIEDAIAKGMTSYDLWGVAPIGSGDNHPWAGISRFKLGFGGETVSTPGTLEVPTSLPVYMLYRSAKLLQKLRRR